MNFLIEMPSPLPILIPFGLKNSPQDSASLFSSFNVTEYISKPYSTTGNIIVLYNSSLEKSHGRAKYQTWNLLVNRQRGYHWAKRPDIMPLQWYEIWEWILIHL